MVLQYPWEQTVLHCLYLFYYEYLYMKNLIKSNFGVAKRFSHTLRYIDDLLTLNNPYFEAEIASIYPRELVLEKTTESRDRLSYLDICVTIVKRKYRTKIYDKREDYNFHIVNFPFMSSNIPTKPAYGIYISQLVRIGRMCVDYGAFVDRNRMITGRLIKQGFRYSMLCKTFKNFS